jgi:hypothetical protein
MILGSTEDKSLRIIIEMVLTEKRDGRPIYSTLLEEPVFFRMIRNWILEGLEDLQKIEEIQAKNTAKSG